MRKEFIIAIMIFAFCNISAQQSISSASGFAKTSEFSISWNIGGYLITGSDDQPPSSRYIIYAKNIKTKASKILISNSDKINIFPNPVKDYLNIELKNSESTEFTIYIYNSSSKFIREVTTKLNSRIPFYDLPNGKYIISVLKNKKKVSSHLIVKN